MLYDFYKGADNIYPWTNDPMLSGVKDCDPDVVNDCLMHLKYENTSDAIQNMYETGRVETQTRAFEQLKQMRHSTFDLSKFTVVGTPTITDDGIASGFVHHKNYIKIPYPIINLKDKSWTVRVGFECTSDISMTQVFYKFGAYPAQGGFYISNTAKPSVAFSTGSVDDSEQSFQGNKIVLNNVTITKGNYYLYELIFDLDAKLYIFNCYENGTIVGSGTYIPTTNNPQIYIFSVATAQSFSHLGIGAGNSEVTTDIGIDLSHFSITVDGKEVFSGNKTGVDTVKINDDYVEIPYTLSKTGAKIVDAVYRDRVIDLYEQQGQACYYTIDEENKNFTLPMGEIYGMIESKGSSSYHPPLLSTIWSGHLLNDMSWLRADTFSWQDGNTYSQAYNELLTEYNDSTSVEETEGDITFKRTPKGYKIALAEQETAITNKYNTDGIAWYYILDTENKKFKLPRTKFGFEGLRDTVGNDIAESLPNITGRVMQREQVANENSGSFYTSGSMSGRYRLEDGTGYYTLFNASRSSSTYQDGAPVQERATQMYLYFYVGEFTKSAEAQTAGLNAELLNNKADVTTPSIQAPYLKTTYLNGASGYNIWSNGYCEQWGESTFKSDGSTVSLLKTMKSAEYIITYMFVSTKIDDYGEGINVNVRTESSFTAHGYHSNALTNVTCKWLVKGYLASGQY